MDIIITERSWCDVIVVKWDTAESFGNAFRKREILWELRIAQIGRTRIEIGREGGRAVRECVGCEGVSCE